MKHATTNLVSTPIPGPRPAVSRGRRGGVALERLDQPQRKAFYSVASGDALDLAQITRFAAPYRKPQKPRARRSPYRTENLGEVFPTVAKTAKTRATDSSMVPLPSISCVIPLSRARPHSRQQPRGHH